MATSKDSLQVERPMIDYILANLKHEPTCAGRIVVPDPTETCEILVYDDGACTCRRAEAERWLRDQQAFVEAYRNRMYISKEELRAAYARLEGE